MDTIHYNPQDERHSLKLPVLVGDGDSMGEFVTADVASQLNLLVAKQASLKFSKSLKYEYPTLEDMPITIDSEGKQIIPLIFKTEQGRNFFVCYVAVDKKNLPLSLDIKKQYVRYFIESGRGVCSTAANVIYIPGFKYMLAPIGCMMYDILAVGLSDLVVLHRDED